MFLIFAAVLNVTIALLAGLAGTDARNVAGALLDIAIAPIPAIFCAVLYFELLRPRAACRSVVLVVRSPSPGRLETDVYSHRRDTPP